MSELKKQVQDDIKAAMKAREQQLLLTLRGLSAAIKQVEVDTRTDVTDEQVKNIIQKEIKKRRDTIDFAREHQRPDILEQNESEMQILQKYLGQQLSEAELEAIIRKLVDTGHDSIGKIMGALNKEHKGSFDGRTASELIKSILS